MWLEQLARRISAIARSKINMAKLSSEEKTKQQRQLYDALEKARSNGEPIVRQLRSAIDERQRKFLQHMLAHLRSDESLQRMCSFEQDEKVYNVTPDQVNHLPDHDSFSELWPALHAFFMQRLWREVKFWNEAPARSFNSETGETSINPEATRFAIFTDDIRSLITEKVAEIDNEAQMLRAMLEKNGDESVISSEMKVGVRKSLFGTMEKALFGITAIIWVPLAVVGSVVSLPIMAGIFTRHKIEGNMKLNRYREDKEGVASALLANFVRCHVTEELLKYPMDEHIRVSTIKSQVEKYFPSAILELETRIGLLKEDERSQEEISASFQPLLQDARLALSHLYNFAANHLHLFPFCEEHFSDLRVPALSSGDFCYTVPANCQTLENPRCAVKIVKQPISSANAYRIFREEQAWRKLCKFQHANIVLFYGLVSFGSPKMVGFVMERRDSSLAEIVFSTSALVPFAWPPNSADKDAAFARMASMALQIARALSFIHHNSYIHRNLVMETVSVFREGCSLVLKLSDFGLSRPGDEITTTVAGALVYLAPEVLNGYGCSSASDVYAFGLLMWEMYHGERAFNWLPACDRSSIYALKERYSGGRMTLLFKDECMSENFRLLVTACIQSQVSMRPPINQVFDTLKQIAVTDEVIL